MMNIPFSPPDITELEIQEVAEALRSGWLTTGPRTKELERQVAAYCGTNKAVCLNSQTACAEMALHVLGVGPGDEVIVPAYTYTATASVVYHVGGGTLEYENPRKTFLNFRNNLLMVYKNAPRKHIWWLMAIRFFMDYLAVVQMIISKKIANAKAVIHARHEFHKLKKQYKKNDVSQFPTLMSKRSIVLDFYLFKKKI